MIAVPSNGGHSAQVKIQLLLEGGAIPVAQMGQDFLFVDAPFDYPPGEANLILQVDHWERRWNVSLPDGMSADSNRVRIAATKQLSIS
jgi:hypothetical protein